MVATPFICSICMTLYLLHQSGINANARSYEVVVIDKLSAFFITDTQTAASVASPPPGRGLCRAMGSTPWGSGGLIPTAVWPRVLDGGSGVLREESTTGQEVGLPRYSSMARKLTWELLLDCCRRLRPRHDAPCHDAPCSGVNISKAPRRCLTETAETTKCKK